MAGNTKKAFTADDARRLVERYRVERPGQFYVALNTVAVKAIEQAEELRSDLSRMAGVVRKLYEIIATLRGGHGSTANAQGAPAASEPVTVPVGNGPRVTASGDVMSPEQVAMESEMDAAIGATDPAESK